MGLYYELHLYFLWVFISHSFIGRDGRNSVPTTGSLLAVCFYRMLQNFAILKQGSKNSKQDQISEYFCQVEGEGGGKDFTASEQTVVFLSPLLFP